MTKEKQETDSEIINETDTSTESSVEKKEKEQVIKKSRSFSTSNLIKE